ncbi:pyridoxal phosphate-dependent decarboxylase family protein [Streptomyces litchfieldiae]|uniref:Pyridoxal-dependent decarboxylase n=1 Tax=Streptomyces litchfieldiae TaxID=3075543 RepID=A0ABU2MT36_9ACTN|nr:pyridoxal-dependent decarboxylase [Streptomyces sp. DSM 44938]MDT0344695.1 pyridoxal-dependent decarboxylase [Streptomyces sp. DSM 44938]
MPAPPLLPDPTLLAGGAAGPRALRPLLDTVLTALAEGAAARCGPLPAGGPEAVTRRLLERCGPALPAHGTGAHDALHSLVGALAEGAADPADPHCAAHLHCPPLAVAAAADLAAAALNPSLDSWDQAPAASALERHLTSALAELVHPEGPAPDALVTSGGTEANLLGLLLARERLGPALRIICGANAHHSVHRAAWLLGLPAPTVLPTPRGILDPAAVADALAGLDALRCTTAAPAPALVVGTAGTTDAGAIDPLPALADTVAAHRDHRPTALHIDAAYGGPLLFSAAHRAKLTGLDRADSVTLDLHKLGWQPVAAGLLTVPETATLAPLGQRADYLNAEDDTEAGLPDLLGRSPRTTRRPDILKIAVTLRALGTTGLAALVDATCAAAAELAALIEAEPRLSLHSRPTISTVLFRPADATDEEVADIRRRLLTEGRAVLGRARARGADGRDTLWLKATLLNPHVQPGDLAALRKLVLDLSPPRPKGDQP